MQRTRGELLAHMESTFPSPHWLSSSGEWWSGLASLRGECPWSLWEPGVHSPTGATQRAWPSPPQGKPTEAEPLPHPLQK